MLVYLTRLTWTQGETSAALAADVQRAMDGGVPLKLAHESAPHHRPNREELRAAVGPVRIAQRALLRPDVHARTPDGLRALACVGGARSAGCAGKRGAAS
eukprot:7381857-Prymnesium_polylepis.1